MLPTNKTEKLTWPDGNWWEFRTFLPVSLEREWLPLAYEALQLDENGRPKVDLANPETMQKVHKIDDILVLKSTTGWSYGLINQETLEKDIPADQYNEAMARMLELYRPLVERSIRTQLGVFMPPSSGGSPSQQSSSSPTTSLKQDGRQKNSNEPIETLWPA